ncbi:Aspartate aminotransferase B [Agrobacterium tumefaciens]|uniref:pyridoxal phosphate-dependent aminotransferase n=1 Tax=Agrobacterium tumefaciens TaxID=358 RepID=UPI001ADB094D|nr:pyridoxal phosphate-dependent aminotransferase [Agrobacterium tumefaciens]QTK81909.1 Aspartate aminotransferase B [Agrobacterium tumefaciens]
MAIQLSERVKSLKPSASIGAKKRVVELQAAGRHIIDFTMGEPDLDTPAHIIDAAIDAMRSGQTHYTATLGIPALRKAIAAKFARDNAISIDPSQVLVGNGAKQLIFEAFAATLNPGDEVIVPAPYWVSYPDIVAVNSGKPVIVTCPEEDGFLLTAKALEAAITPKTRWLILNSPSNPTGAIYDQAGLEAIAEVLRRHPQVALMTDEIYEHLIYDGAAHVTPLAVAPDLAGRCLIVNGMSKAYAMTGWRLGFVAGPVELIGAIAKLLGQNTTCANSITQMASVTALEADQQVVADMSEDYRHRRNRMVELLSGIDGIRCMPPAGAFYLFPNVSGLVGRTTPAGKTLVSDIDVMEYFLDEANVAVMDGTSYGMSPYLRLSFATALPDIEEGCRRIATACAKLR